METKMKNLENLSSMTLSKKIMKLELSSVKDRKKAISILETRGDLKKVNFNKLIFHHPGNEVLFVPAKNATKLDKTKTLKGIILKAWADHKRGMEWVIIKVLDSNIICTKRGERVQFA